MRAVLRIMLLLMALVLLPAPALADGAFANYVTTVTGISPAVPGVKAVSASNGEYMTVTNTGSTSITIYGYEHEPYVRIGTDGVWENTLSPAVYLNKEQTIGELPKDTNAEAAPHWKKISTAHRFQWHDHRIHWMGATQPPVVSKDPDHQHLIASWKVPYSTGDGTTATGNIEGTLVYEPSSHVGNYITWGAIGAALVVVVSLQLFLGRRRRTAKQAQPSAEA